MGAVAGTRGGRKAPRCRGARPPDNAPPVAPQQAVRADTVARPSRSALPFGLSFAFFASGFAALVDEVAAARFLSIPLGADAPALAAVLSALLVGFALGGAGAGWLLARGVEARRLGLVLEAGLVVCALAAPFALPAVAPFVAAAGAALGLTSPAFHGVRFLIALAVCLPPALLMGATFPVALRLARASGLEGAPAASAVYAPNTLGAAAGALAAGFVALPFVGYGGAFALAALANALSFLAILRWAPRSSSLDEAPVRDRSPVPVAPLVATFVAGLSAFTMEVLLARAAITVFGASTYAFTAVLVAFLLGLSLGAPLARSAGTDPAVARRRLGHALLAAGALLVAGVLGFRFYLGLDDPFRASNRFPQLAQPWMLPLYQAVVSLLLLLPPALALGAAFPLAVAAARGRGASEDRAAGAVYASNTLGALAGTLLATFVLLPQLGTRYGLAVAILALAVGAGVALWPRTALTLLLPPLVFVLIALRSAPPAGTTPLFFREGVASTVSVESSAGADGRPMRSISVNGTVVATEGLLDLRLQRTLGHLPALLHPAPKRTLVIGLGSGVTAGALARTPGVESTRIVELEPFVVEAARLFGETNHGVAAGGLPGVEIEVGDGRTHLLATDVRYDVITCDPIHPWVAGAGNLYSRECFRAERERLAPGGVVALWLPLYKLRTEDLRVVAKTFTAELSPCALYVTGYDAILIGGDGALPTVDVAALRERFARVAEDLREVEIHDVEELLSGFAMDDAALRAFAGDAPSNTDARPLLEYRAPMLYLTSYATEFLADVRRRTVDPRELFGSAAGIDPAAAARAVERRGRAIDRFLEQVQGDVRAAIAAASAALREPRAR